MAIAKERIEILAINDVMKGIKIDCIKERWNEVLKEYPAARYHVANLGDVLGGF